jgi:hypothetical protein
MAIEITNVESKPSVVYNRVLLNSLKIDQKPILEDDTPAYYKLRIEYTVYGVDENGQRQYKPKINVIHLDDVGAHAMEKAMQGDLDLAQAMAAIEAAFAKIVEDQTSLGSARVI